MYNSALIIIDICDMKTWPVILSLLISSLTASAQDTISIYFDFGVSKVREDQMDILNTIPSGFDLSSVDSVHFIGMADSVGDFNANIKLSEKRANNAAIYCSKLFPPQLRGKVKALGELSNGKDNRLNRRVDIILFSPQIKSEETDTMVGFKPHENIELCYYVDNKLLHRCHLRTISNRNKKLIIIETTDLFLPKRQEQYFGSTDKEGNFIPKLLKWNLKRTGKLWWAKSKYVATVPKKDFEKYKIFTIGNPPCKICNQDFNFEAKIQNEINCRQVDRFLMENIQFKRIWFNNREINVRAPKEYVDINDHYFIGCDYTRELKWEMQKGRKHRYYYYTKLPISFNYVPNIVREMECCEAKPEPSQCDDHIYYCDCRGGGGGGFQQPGTDLTLIAEIGTHFQKPGTAPYIAFGLSKSYEANYSNFMIGTDINLSLFGSLRYEYHFFSFSYQAFNPFAKWQSPSKIRSIERYGQLYTGVEFKTKFNSADSLNYFEENLHFGIAILNTRLNALIPRMFIQAGVGYDYSRNISTGLYPIFQIGFTMKLVTMNFRGIKPGHRDVRHL
jgi:hypothetical protein